MICHISNGTESYFNRPLLKIHRRVLRGGWCISTTPLRVVVPGQRKAEAFRRSSSCEEPQNEIRSRRAMMMSASYPSGNNNWEKKIMTMTTRQKWDKKGADEPWNNPFEKQPPHHATGRNIFLLQCLSQTYMSKS